MFRPALMAAIAAALVSAGCGAPSTDAPTTGVQAPPPIVADAPADVDAPAPALAEAATEPEGAAAADGPAAPDPNRDFAPSDPASVELATGRPQLVEFFAYWCPTCQAMKPVVHGLEDAYADRVDFVYLDIDDPATEPLKAQLAYEYQPFFALVDGDGTLVQTWQGPTQAETFAAAFDALAAD